MATNPAITHRLQYKHEGFSPSSVRKKMRDSAVEIRKNQREKLLSAKRLRCEENPHLHFDLDGPDRPEQPDFPIEKSDDGEEYSERNVKLVATLLKKKSSEAGKQLKYLRTAFSYTNDFVNAFLEVDGALFTLIGFLTGNDSDLKLEAAWCITNIAASDHEHAELVAKNAAPYLITYLKDGSVLLQDQSAWALGNIAADSPEIRQLLKAQGIIPPLIDLVKSENQRVVQSVAFALCNMALDEENLPLMMESDLPDVLLKKIQNENEDLNVVGELSWMLTYFTTDLSYCESVWHQGMLGKAIHWLCKIRPHQLEYLFVVTPLLRSLGNIFHRHEEHIKEALQYDQGVLLPTLNNFLVSNKRYLIKECLWLLSSITGSTVENTRPVVEMKHLVANIARHLTSAYEIKKEASLCICNIAYHGFVLEMSDSSIMNSFMDMFKIPDTDIISIALQYFEMLLSKHPEGKQLFEQMYGVGYLEALEFNDNAEVRERAVYLMETFYENDDEEEEQKESERVEVEEAPSLEDPPR